MNDIELFSFHDHAVRTVLIDGDPGFVHADVCAVLEIGNPSDALRRLDDDERGVVSIDGPNGRRLDVNVITEAGLYSLILGSRKPQARPFKRWVTHEVLPQIRQTGSYSATPAIPQTMSEALRLAADQYDRAIAAEQKVAELAPAAESWNVLAQAEGDFLVADAAKILSRDPRITIGQNRLFTVLGELGWIYRAAGDQKWRTKQTAIESGRLSEIPMTHYHPRTGQLVMDPPQIRVTAKGLHWLHQHLGAERGAA